MGHSDIEQSTIYSVVSRYSESTPDASVVEAPGRAPLTYTRLEDQIRYTVNFLNRAGISLNDRVSVVLPNGPEMAVAFLAVASGATCAPLNPQYKAEEYAFFLSDMRAKALIVEAGTDCPVVKVARELGINVIRLSPVGDREAGIFTLSCDEEHDAVAANEAFAAPEDVALVLHTSGTTSRPKMVPLTHINVCASAANIRGTLRLTGDDRCLNVMPLFHIHGLVGALLSSISAGATVVCTPGFQASEFFGWLRDLDPTWYTAVPTIHQAVLSRAKENVEAIKGSSLRFIRSSSSSLPPKVMADLEETFDVPVIEAYGMTEASHQIASNPLPPMKRKAGSVGLASGAEVSIMDEAGNKLPQRSVGEIAIMGPNVTAGYEGNPEANAGAFAGGWLRTGDQGYLDEEGYLFITDRIKEIINRGGEKISPREVDEVILGHPGVRQIVTFSMKDPRLGEEVAAAVVAKEGASLTEWDIQKHVARRLADFKVPRRVVFLDELPKGPTGKVQRVGLAGALGLSPLPVDVPAADTEYRAPSSQLEKDLARIWSEVLKIERIGVNDNYFTLGGDSLRAEEIVTRVSKLLRMGRIPLVIFLHAPTVAMMARLLQGEAPGGGSSLVSLQPRGFKPPIYLIHACEGEVLFFTDLVRLLGGERPVYAMRAPGLEGDVSYNNVEGYAAHYIREIRANQAEGPYYIGGAGIGGVIALEASQQLRSMGEEVGLLTLIDTIPPRSIRREGGRRGRGRGLPYYIDRLVFYIKNGQFLRFVYFTLDGSYRRLAKYFNPRFRVWEETRKVVDRYTPKKYDGRVLLFVSEKRFGYPEDPDVRRRMWDGSLTGPVESHVIPGEHLEVFREPNVRVLADKLKEYLERV